MTDDFVSKLNPLQRFTDSFAEPRDSRAERPAATSGPVESQHDAPFSSVSADRQHKLMCEFRFLNGNAKAIAYSYLVALDFDPSVGINLDFSGYYVTITGRHLGPLFSGLVAQRTAMVREQDPLLAEANGSPDATVITSIIIEERHGS